MTTQTLTAADQMYNEACTALGQQPQTLEAFAFLGDKATAFLALHRITTVIEAKNAGHKFNWQDYSELKYTPYFEMDNEETGFSFDVVNCWLSCSDVGSRLCFKNRADAEEIAKVMFEDYKTWMNN